MIYKIVTRQVDNRNQPVVLNVEADDCLVGESDITLMKGGTIKALFKRADVLSVVYPDRTAPVSVTGMKQQPLRNITSSVEAW